MFRPTPLNLPSYPLKLKRIKDKVYVFDELRKKILLLTPEEWVRQHWIHYLHTQKNYPKSLMHIEGGLNLHGLQKRTDLVIYNSQGEKILIAEFKAPGVKINEKTFEQINNYNMVHKIPLLLVSNGLDHFFCKINLNNNQYEFLKDLPNYM
ncbi:type I restriction enzyme HsdR N-terminal domain-containing protein [Sphingobacterium sp. SGG-5]|uniref:type I restriction enzyme HsdR N-terminal domain-containing protein n=1 Tax=Sphingobacterium sp. SGG-5 TaxID=2710881 RepID=UPI0013EA2A81|nr:type I restriction enzyme HsdR N-terminal domain-containing protein [Sphingobacterium sp. SGG-5]NGM62195.1 type I restriction enzyme HsdR N-terminal domain-containing protein [Sphingobacterium sp. SGG-5]